MATYVTAYRFDAVDGVTKILDRLAGKEQKLRSGFGRLKQRVSSVTAPIRKVKRAFISFERRALQVPKRIGNQWEKLTNRFGTLLPTLGAGMAVHGAFNIIRQAKNEASDLNESLNKSRVVFGDYFKDVEHFSKLAQDNAGITRNIALSNASSFGSMFKELKFGQQEVAELSKGAVQLASDLASFHNLDPNQAFEALFSGIKGETQVLATNFGIVLDEMMVRKKAFEMGLTDSTKKTLPKDIKVRATYAAILDQTADAQGDFGRTANEVANSERILAAQTKNLMADFGQLFLPLWTKVVIKLRESVAWIQENKSEIKKWAKVGGTLIGILFGIWGAARTIIGVASMLKTIRLGYIALKQSVTIAKIAQMAFNVVANMNPFGWIAIAIGGIVLLIKNWDTVKEYLFKFGKWLWKNHPFRWMIDITDRIFPGFKEKLKGLFSFVVDKFLKFFNWLKGSKLGTWISEQFSFDLKMPDWFGNKKKEKSQDEEEETMGEPEDPYGSVSKILGNSSTSGKDGTGKPGQLGGAVNNKISSVTSGGGSIKNITVNIDKLIEKMIFNTTNLAENKAKIQKEVAEALIAATNDVNYS